MSDFVVLSHSRPSHVTPGAGVVLGDAMAMALPGTKALVVAISAVARIPRPTDFFWFIATIVGCHLNPSHTGSFTAGPYVLIAHHAPAEAGLIYAYREHCPNLARAVSAGRYSAIPTSRAVSNHASAAGRRRANAARAEASRTLPPITRRNQRRRGGAGGSRRHQATVRHTQRRHGGNPPSSGRRYGRPAEP